MHASVASWRSLAPSVRPPRGTGVGGALLGLLARAGRGAIVRQAAADRPEPPARGEPTRRSPAAASPPSLSAHAPRHAPLVAFRRVAFAYDPDRAPVLDDVSLAIPEGSQTAIVGPSGAGKSTLFALLQRLYEPCAGTILLEGRDLSTIPRGQLRRTIGSVEQDAPVLAGTLRDNLRSAAPEASGAELAAVVAEARLEELVARLPDGLDSELASSGTSLSGGERQRIAIARALLGRSRILLLDEANSQLDARDEQALRDTISRAAMRTTVLVIAHRLSTVLTADQIVVLDGGRVRASGTHHELIATDALYRGLAATQLIAEPAG